MNSQNCQMVWPLTWLKIQSVQDLIIVLSNGTKFERTPTFIVQIYHNYSKAQCLWHQLTGVVQLLKSSTTAVQRFLIQKKNKHLPCWCPLRCTCCGLLSCSRSLINKLICTLNFVNIISLRNHQRPSFQWKSNIISFQGEYSYE